MSERKSNYDRIGDLEIDVGRNSANLLALNAQLDDLYRRLSAPASTERNDPKPDKTCRWTYDSEHDKYDTSCGESFSFTHGGTKDNKFAGCPFCVKPIEVK